MYTYQRGDKTASDNLWHELQEAEVAFERECHKIYVKFATDVHDAISRITGWRVGDFTPTRVPVLDLIGDDGSVIRLRLFLRKQDVTVLGDYHPYRTQNFSRQSFKFDIGASNSTDSFSRLLVSELEKRLGTELKAGKVDLTNFQG